MPVESLSDGEAAVFGRYGGPPTRAELDRMSTSMMRTSG